jgi:DNA-directed RNA polymerase
MINSIQSLSAIYENTIGVFILKMGYSLETIFGNLIDNTHNSNINNKKTLFDASFKLLSWEHIIEYNNNIGKILNDYIKGDFFTNTDIHINNNNMLSKEKLKEARVAILLDDFENIKCLILKKNLIGNFIWMSSASVISILMCAYST